MDENLFLGSDEEKSKDAKWNLFRFQDHLLNWMSISAEHWQQRDYPNSFEALTIVYTDSFGFFTPEEQKEIKAAFKKALSANNKYTIYNADWIATRVKQHAYTPPQDIYSALLEFRQKLLNFMTKHNLTIPQIKKGSAGAGSV